MQLSIVIPSHNEEGIIKDTVQAIHKYAHSVFQEFEIIVVENGSTDKTADIIKNLQSKYSKIKLLNLPQPSYGDALLEGIKTSKGELVIIYNADFYDLKFIDIAKDDLSGYDIIIGSKNLPSSKDKRPFLRILVTKLFNLLLKLLFNFKGTDTHGIKIFRRTKIINIINNCKTKTGIVDSEIIIKAERANLKKKEVPVTVIEKRPPRFKKRFINTFSDIYELSKALNDGKTPIKSLLPKFLLLIALLLILALQIKISYPKQEIAFIKRNLNLTYDQKMGVKQGIDLYRYLLFLKNNLPQNATVLIPPMKYPWPYTGNGGYMLYFLYPRKIVSLTFDNKIPEGVTYSLMLPNDNGEILEQNKAWPPFKIDSKKIIYLNENTNLPETVFVNYDPLDSRNINSRGIIELK